MPRPLRAAAALAIACAVVLAPRIVLAAPSPAPSFVVENLFPGVSFVAPTDLAWLPDRRALVTEKSGLVWLVNAGIRSAQPVVDLRASVLDQNDRGLISVAVDPNYFVNHYIYLLYVVDPDSNNVETDPNAYSRLVRYTMNTTDSSTVVASSRRVLFGRTWTEGAVSCSDSHTGDDLEWGNDGSLLVSIGDGASYTTVDAGGLHPSVFSPTRTELYEDIGAFRAQSLTSLTGKVLRINPATGLGYMSNPFRDADLGSRRSRIWAYGLRNPFRISVRPGTGTADTSAGNPGTVYIGDVGWTTTEEQSIATTGGRNFGWPCMEGNLGNAAYQAANPLHNGCGSVGTPDNPNAFTAPMIYYGHGAGNSNFGLVGNTAIGGTFTTTTNYPTAYRGYVFGDYGSNWIRVGTLNGSGIVTATTSLVTDADGPVSFSREPLTGDIVYVAINTGEVRRIRYTGATSNRDPVANATGTPPSGPAPLAVAFSSAGSSDPDGDPIGFAWAFGDGQGSTQANPSYTYTSPGQYRAILTVTDSRGGLARDTVLVNAAGPSTFPSTAVLDDFNRANGSPVDAAHPWVRTGGQAVINANQWSLPSAGDAIWNATFGAAQEAFVTLPNASWPTQFLLFLKCQGTSPSAAHLALFYEAGAGSNRLGVESFDPARNPNFITHGRIDVTLAAGDRIGARTLADGRLEVFRNGAPVGTIDVSSFATPTTGGRIGIGWWGGATTAFRADDFGGGNVAVSSNTPPTVTITSPVAGSTYIDGQTMNLACAASDAQDASAALQFHWDVRLHHNTHVHYTYMFDTPTGSFPADDHDDGTGVFLRLHVRVTDSGGLVARDSLDVYPEMDLSPSPISVLPASPTSNDSLTITFRVRNLARMLAPISRWRLTAGATLLGEGDVVVPGEDSVLVSVRRGPLAAGTYTLRARADSLNTVRETVETNNASVATLVVSSPPVEPPSGFPTMAVLDDFNRADGSPIDATHPWVRSGAQAVIDAGALGLSGAGDVVWDAVFAPTQEVFARVPVASWPKQFLLHMKCQGTSPASAHVSVYYDVSAPTSQLVVESFDPASGYVTHGAVPVTLAAGDVVGARARADGVMELYRNGVQTGSVSFASWAFAAQAGRVGMGWWGANLATFRADDFGGGTTVTGPAPVIDLVTSAISVIPAAPDADDSLTVSFRIRNTGTSPAPASRWRLRAGGTLLGEGDVAVPALDSVLVSVRRGPLAAATYTLRARADSLGTVAETNENNNASVATLVVTPVTAVNRAPTAVAAGTPTSGTAPLAVSFVSTGSSDPDGDPLSFAWAFGDGGTATTASASRTYAAAGTYVAVLTVSDGRGGSDTASVVITATAPPSGFPATALLDDFNRPNGSPIDATHPWVRSGGLATLNGNALALPSAGDVIWNASFGATQEAYVTVANTSWPTQFLLFLKCQGTTPAASHVSVIYNGNGSGDRIEVESYDPARSPAYVVHGTLAGTFVAGDVLGARALASNQLEVYRNGVRLGAVAIGAWSGASLGGRIGLGWWGGATTAFRADAFGGGLTLPGAPALAFSELGAQPAAAEVALPQALALSSPRPNPSANGVSLILALPRAASVRFAVYDLHGREVWSAAEREHGAGQHTLVWEGAARGGAPVGAGVYLARIQVDGEAFTRRLVRVR